MSKKKFSLPVAVSVFSLPLENHYKNCIIGNPELLDVYLKISVRKMHLPKSVVRVFKDNGFNKAGDILNGFSEFESLEFKDQGLTPNEKVLEMIAEDMTNYFKSKPVMKKISKKGKGTGKNKLISMTEGVLGLACQHEIGILSKLINIEREPGNLLNVTIGTIDWSAKNRRILRKLRVKRIGDLSKIKASQLLNTKSYGEKSIVELVVKLGKYFSEYYREVREDSSSLVDPNDIERLVKHMLSKLSSQQKKVLSRRFGLWDGKRETLAELGRQFGLTRERIRQIQVIAISKLKRLNWMRIVERNKTSSTKDDHLVVFMRKLFNARLLPFIRNNYNIATKAELTQIIYSIGGGSDEIDLANAFLSDVFFDSRSIFRDFVIEFTNQVIGIHKEDREVYLKTVRTAKDFLVEKAVPQSMDDFLSFFEKIGFEKKHAIDRNRLRRFLAVSSIAKDSTGKFGLRRWKYFDSYTIKCMAERAVVEIGEPAHFSEIAKSMSRMFPKYGPFNSHRVHARMETNKDIFTWISPGYYGLKSWGLKRVPPVKDCLIEILQRADRPLHKDEIIKGVLKKRRTTATSVYTTLSANKKVFKRFPGSRFGLTEWE